MLNGNNILPFGRSRPLTVKSGAKNAGERGSALIITLLLVALLVSLVVEFAYEVYIDTSAFSNWKNAQKASLVARSGQTLSSRYLRDISEDSYTYDREVDFPVNEDFGPGAELSVTIEDESAKFNINSLIRPNGLTDQEALSSLKKLLEYLNINPDLALTVADWIDPDSDPRITDSENNAKNTYLWSLYELKSIDGIDNINFEALKPLVTVHGNNRININTARLAVIISLHKDMTEDMAQRIIDYRQDAPFEDKAHVVRVSGLGSVGILISNRITVKSIFFGVISEASVNGIKRIIESVLDTSMNVHFWREV